MNVIRPIVAAAAACALTVGGLIVGGADAQGATLRDCRFYDFWAGASVTCPGMRAVLELDCVGLGRNSGEQTGARIFYHRTSAVTDATGFTATDCGQGSYLGSGVAVGRWVRAV